jgi:integrase
MNVASSALWKASHKAEIFLVADRGLAPTDLFTRQ